MRRASPSTCRLLVPESGLGGLLTPPSSNAQGPLPCAISPPACAVPGGLQFGFYTNQKERQSVCVGERENVCECVSVCVCICTGADFFFVWCVDYGVATPCRLPTFPGLFFERALQRYGLFCIRDLFCLINSTSMRLSSLATGWRRPTERFIRSFPAKEPYNYAALERDLKDKASDGSWPPSAYL